MVLIFCIQPRIYCEMIIQNNKSFVGGGGRGERSWKDSTLLVLMMEVKMARRDSYVVSPISLNVTKF